MKSIKKISTGEIKSSILIINTSLYKIIIKAALYSLILEKKAVFIIQIEMVHLPVLKKVDPLKRKLTGVNHRR